MTCEVQGCVQVHPQKEEIFVFDRLALKSLSSKTHCHANHKTCLLEITYENATFTLKSPPPIINIVQLAARQMCCLQFQETDYSIIVSNQ